MNLVAEVTAAAAEREGVDPVRVGAAAREQIGEEGAVMGVPWWMDFDAVQVALGVPPVDEEVGDEER